MGKLTSKEEAKQAATEDARYWLYEEPELYTSGKNTFRLYQKAGKLQISLPDYVKSSFSYGQRREEIKPGRLAALDLNALREDPETLQWLLSILQKLQEPA